MKYSKHFSFFSFMLVSLLGVSSLSAQQNFQLSSKFYEADFTRSRIWSGNHRFGNIFCLKFPRGNEVKGFAYALYNNNTLYFSRATYDDTTALYVVASTIPAGRSLEIEIEKQASEHLKSVEKFPGVFTLHRTDGILGPSLAWTIRNSLEGNKGSPFPFARSFASRPDGHLASISVHRLFVHNGSRVEVAGLRYFKTPIEMDREADAVSDLTTFVEGAAESLQSCTANLQANHK